MKPSRIFLMFVALSGACLVVPASIAQDAPPLTDDQKKAMEQISERVNTATISFLASDDLKGRGTGSKGLEIAGAYVASRYRGAGLKGIEGSFFQSKVIEALRTPTTGIAVRNNNENLIEHLGLYTGGSEEFSFTGNVQLVDSEDREKKYEGPVAMKLDSSISGRRAMAQIARQTNRLKSNGATALLVMIPDDHEIVQTASQRTTNARTVNPRMEPSIPVLLIPDSTTIENIGSITLPPEIKVEQKVSNVIGVLEGSDPELKEEAVVISAHLDHLGEVENGTEDKIYNGADDNASGVTGILAVADAFGALSTPPKRTVIFIAYWGEERGFLGSRYLIENPVWPLEKIVANVNLEMIGRPEPGASGKAWMTGWEHSDLGSLMNAGSSRVDFEIFEHPQHSNRLYRSSDNWPFAQAGIVAHSFSAGSLHNDYHQPGDEWEKLDLRHMTLVCKGLFAATLPIANGHVTPKGADGE